MPKWKSDSVVILKSFWCHCFFPIRSALRRSILQFIYYLLPRFSNKIQVNTAFKKLSYMCFIPSRAWLKRTFSVRFLLHSKYIKGISNQLKQLSFCVLNCALKLSLFASTNWVGNHKKFRCLNQQSNLKLRGSDNAKGAEWFTKF